METLVEPEPVSTGLFDLSGRTAVVTGAARGMGRALALGFVQFGANVVLADIDVAGAERVVDEVGNLGGRALAVHVDHTDEEAVRGLAAAANQEFGRVDVLVNNAGVLSNYDFFEMSLADWDRVLNINLRGPLLCMRALMPGMIDERSGSVINIGSSWSSRGSVFFQDGGGPDYCVSKAGLQALTRSAAQDSAAYGVRVNAIAPGAVDTPMHIHHREFLYEYEKFIPLGRMQVATDVVGAAIFLASDASAYVTGQTLHVNGGLLMVD